MLTSVEATYAAATIDCEGCIRLGLTARGWVLKVSVVNTDARLIDWLHQKFGGSIYEQTRLQENHKARYEWAVTGKKALPVLKVTRSYLMLKGDQADLALEFLEELSPGSGHHRTPGQLERIKEIASRFKELNRRGLC